MLRFHISICGYLMQNCETKLFLAGGQLWSYEMHFLVLTAILKIDLPVQLPILKIDLPIDYPFAKMTTH